MAQFKTAFARITEKYHKLTCEVNDLSVLFHCIHEIITTSNCSYPESDRNEENWPCKFIYEGEVHVYQYRKRSIEVSILNEEATGSDIQFCYTVINFPNETETPLYYVHRFNKKDIPTLALLNETADSQRYRNIYFAIENIWITFCSKVVSKKIEKTAEYCIYAIQPILSMEEEEEPAKKSKKSAESSSKVRTAAKQFVSPLPTGYERLIALYKSVTNKITEAGRLMALVHEILRDKMGCTSSIEAETWPGGVDYKGKTIEVWLSHKSSLEGQEEKVELRCFYLSILENDKEFYLSLRVGKS